MESISEDPGRRKTQLKDPNAGGLRDDFGAIYEDIFPDVLAYVLTRLEDVAAAEDIVSDTFEQALRGWEGFRGESSVRTWILGIARHVVAQYWRKEDRCRRAATSALIQQCGDAGGRDTSGVVDAIVLGDAIQQLGWTERVMIGLHYGEGLLWREVAQQLALSDVAVRVRMCRALQTLRLLMVEGR
jgi:RNA polymerase sigma-70 factor (ECF subfamily)